MGRGHRTKHTDRFVKSLAIEQATDDETDPIRKTRRRHRKVQKAKPSGNQFEPLSVDKLSDSDDEDFQDESGSVTDASTSGSPSIEEITNEEVANSPICFPIRKLKSFEDCRFSTKQNRPPPSRKTGCSFVPFTQ
jgi:hypothetical protein